MFDADYQRKLPLAAAIASCATDEEEDITFEMFDDAKHAREFVDNKQAYLCKRAGDMQLTDFPGFAYVDGGAPGSSSRTKRRRPTSSPRFSGAKRRWLRARRK